MKLRLVALAVAVFWIVTPIAAAECLRSCPSEPAASDHCSQPARASDVALKGGHDCSTHTADQVPATASVRFDLSVVGAPTTSVAVRLDSTFQTALDAVSFPDASPPAGFLIPLRQ